MDRTVDHTVDHTVDQQSSGNHHGSHRKSYRGFHRGSPGVIQTQHFGKKRKTVGAPCDDLEIQILFELDLVSNGEHSLELTGRLADY